MNTIELESWEAYCSKVDELKDRFAGLPILFRGQAKGHWPLKTTLERFSKGKWTIRKYCELLVRCVSQIRPSADGQPEVPNLSDIMHELDKDMHPGLVPIPNAISYYLTYLRHYGFPSPLLDWTTSPNVAAFFAFSENTKSRNVAVFAFVDSLIDVRGIWLGKPQITASWLNVNTHERHTRQKSCYTIATKYGKDDHRFVRHDSVLKEDGANPSQDILFRLLIPTTESGKALKYLDRLEINHFSLMDDIEAHLKTLAYKEIRLKGL